ncbi:MAG: hypothetical protein ABL903_19950 [Methylococcales bacterium]
MELIYTIEELGCSAVKLSYPEWLAIQEPLFFNFVETQEDKQWLFLQQENGLAPYTTQIALIRVDKKFYKLTGKQRQKMWSSGKIDPPDFLIAQIFDLTEIQFSALNAEAKKMQMKELPLNEINKSIYEELGLVFSSARLKQGFINEAINIALRGRQRSLQDKRETHEKQDIDMKKAIQLFTPELTFIDNINPKADIFATGVLAGALIMMALNKPIKDFLIRLNDRQGETKNGFNDPIENLLKAIYSHRMDQRPIQAQMSITLCKKTIQAITLWEEGPQSAKYWRKRDLTGIDHRPYVRELRLLKQINAIRDL